MYAMTTALSIQVSVTQAVAGTLLGALVEGMIPRFTEGGSASSLVFEALVQAGLTGAAISVVGPRMSPSDPTYGILFSGTLLAAQPDFAARIAKLSAIAKTMALQAVQKSKAPVAGV